MSGGWRVAPRGAGGHFASQPLTAEPNPVLEDRTKPPSKLKPKLKPKLRPTYSSYASKAGDHTADEMDVAEAMMALDRSSKAGGIRREIIEFDENHTVQCESPLYLICAEHI